MQLHVAQLAWPGHFLNNRLYSSCLVFCLCELYCSSVLSLCLGVEHFVSLLFRGTFATLLYCSSGNSSLVCIWFLVGHEVALSSCRPLDVGHLGADVEH